MLVGILVTMVASLRPALRATRVPPIAAVREGAMLPERARPRGRTLRSVGLSVAGFAALVFGLFAPGLGTSGVLIWMGLGALMIFVGVALLSARFVPRARRRARLAGGADRRRRWAGWRARTRVATRSARPRPPSALMIGLALVTLVAMLAAGDHLQLQGRGERALQGRLRGHRAEQLLAAAARGGPRRRRSTPGITCVGSVRADQARDLRPRRAAHRRGSDDRRHAHAQVEAGLAGRAVRARAERRLHRRQLRQEAPPPRGLTGVVRDADGRSRERRDQGNLQTARGRLAVRGGDGLERGCSTAPTSSRRTSSRSSTCAAVRRRPTRRPSSARCARSRTPRCRTGRSSWTTRSAG